jgi:hypothetical protein
MQPSFLAMVVINGAEVAMTSKNIFSKKVARSRSRVKPRIEGERRVYCTLR